MTSAAGQQCTAEKAHARTCPIECIKCMCEYALAGILIHVARSLRNAAELGLGVGYAKPSAMRMKLPNIGILVTHAIGS